MIKLKLPTNYHYGYWLRFIADRRINAIEEVTENSYSRKSLIDSNVQLELVFHSDYCEATVRGLDADSDEKNWLKNQLSHMLDINIDHTRILEKLSKVKKLSSILDEGYILPIPRTWGAYEAILRAILEQLVTVKAANTISNRFFNQMLTQDKIESVESKLLSDHFVLSPRHIDHTVLDDVTYLSKMKKTAIMQSGELIENQKSLLRSDLSYKEYMDAVMPIKGIGAWTCSYSGMRFLTDPNIYIDKDYVVDKWMALHKLKKESVLKRVSPFASYFANYIWFSLE